MGTAETVRQVEQAGFTATAIAMAAMSGTFIDNAFKGAASEAVNRAQYELEVLRAFDLASELTPIIDTVEMMEKHFTAADKLSDQKFVAMRFSRDTRPLQQRALHVDDLLEAVVDGMDQVLHEYDAAIQSTPREVSEDYADEAATLEWTKDEIARVRLAATEHFDNLFD